MCFGFPIEKVSTACLWCFLQDESTSPATSNVGTPMYMAPELIKGVPLYDGKVCMLSSFSEPQ